ncbi:MAG: DUF2207 family protein [Bacilli bacterium]
MKKIIFTLVLFLVPSIILANEIYNIDMNIYVDNNGTAHVTEEWTTNLIQGTEGYKPYYNLGESKISNFKVSMNGKEYTYNSDYNINASFNEKKYKNGFHYIDNGVELCFGITNYGKNTYTLSYDISNFVVNTSDGYQMIYWTLFPYDYNPSPKRVYIKIYSDFKYADTLDVWGYGKYGAPTYVYDGYIEMDSESTVYSSEYMTILVKFPKNTFTLNTTVDKTFDEYLNMANEGSTAYKVQKKSFFRELLNYIPVLISASIPFAIVFIAIRSSIVNGYGYKNNKVINKKETLLFRDIPCNKDIYYANTLTKLNNEIFTGYKETNIFGAIILKWVKENKVKFINQTKGVFNKETSSIDLTLNPTFDNVLEKELFDIMYEASGDGILETKELEKWNNKHYTKFFNLFERINKVEIEKLKQGNHIYTRANKEECKKKNIMDDTIYEESVKLYGLKKFLDEFSKIDTREVLEVHIWDEYLMFAYIFGIADKVAKQLKNLYPEVLTNQDNYVDFDTLMYINYISTRSVNAATTARSRAESYSSGGGGFSSGGGGGGSFGGGGGGGGFR